MQLFELWAKLALDSTQFNDGLDDAESAANKFASGFTSAMATAAKAGLAAITAAATARSAETEESSR